MNENLNVTYILFILTAQKERYGEIKEWLQERHTVVLLGNLDDLEEAYFQQDPHAILMDETCTGDNLALILSNIRLKSDAGIMYCLSNPAASPSLAELFSMDVSEVLLPTLPIEERYARILNQLRNGEKAVQMREAYRELYLHYEQVMQQNEELELLSKADALTGLFGRRYMMRKLQEESARNQRSRLNFSVLICSLDRFPELSNRYGKVVCDRIIKEVATMLSNSCRAYDIVARWSEEQYMLLLPETDLVWAFVVAERCRRNIERYYLEEQGEPVPLTLSIGLAEFHQNDGVGGCLRRTEQALKEAILRGTNTVVYCDTAGGELNYRTYKAAVDGAISGF
ncbi:MAG: GGDEF domain-containing protein [Symbiobacteriaceae bacterium]|nr:GGDEF domain-containing protein [Symbiobacteriaceae bacterium]